MAPMLRKAIGAFKDQASISLAKVAGSVAPDLDVAILKATSHDELPIEEKYVQQILHLTSFSRAYSSACVAGLVRRMNKTRNWIVALKTLMLTHRLLRDGDPGLEQELMMAGRRGLSGSDFRDESDANAWDFSAFVRSYGLFLDERLDFSFGSLGPRAKSDRRSAYNESRSEYDDGSYYQDDYGSGRDHEVRGRREESQQGQKSKQVKDMKPEDLMEKFSAFQRLLERVLVCRPAGAARGNRLVQIALYPIVRDSFQLHSDIREGLAILLDAFFDMDQRDSVKVFDIYSRSAKQVDELISFYGYCKTLGVCRNTEIPPVEKISEELLETMEDFLRNRSGSTRGGKRPKSPEPRPRSPQRDREEMPDEASYEVNGMKALPAPPVQEPPKTEVKAADFPKEERKGDLVDLGEPAITSEEHGDKLALALFSGTEKAPTSTTTKWETFSGGSGGAAMAEGNTGSGWELALVETTSEISKPINNSLAGGFDRLLLDSMYDQAVDRRNLAAATAPAGSASSIALPGRAQSSFLALPAPPDAMQAATSQDPFAASVSVPPPAYVQMADVQHKQHLLVQEQQLWLQYQQDGMQGYHSLMKVPTNPFAAYFQPNAYPVPYYGNNSYYR